MGRNAKPHGAVRVVAVAALAVAGMATVASADAGQSGDLRGFCRTVVDLTKLIATEGSIPAEDAAPDALERFDTKLKRLLDRAERTAPPEIADDVGFASELTSLDPRESPYLLGIDEPIRAIKRFAADECGFNRVTVTAREYALEGMPETLKTGTVVFELVNEGAEVHELAFGRLKGDASLPDLLELPEEERVRLNRIQEVGLRALALPGESDVAVVAFTRPGRYSVADFVPVGTTTIEAGAVGAPHADEGMFAEFRVKAR